MDESKSEIGPEEVMAHFSKALPNNPCITRCTKKYQDDLKNCKGDRGCIARVTGHYVICVLSCRR